MRIAFLGYGQMTQGLINKVEEAGHQAICVTNLARISTDFVEKGAFYSYEEILRNPMLAVGISHVVLSFRFERMNLDDKNVRLAVVKLLDNVDCHFLLLSSVAVYGNISQRAYENTATRPLSEYGIQKLELERCVRSQLKNSNKLSILRIANLYGMPVSSGVINRALVSILHNNPLSLPKIECTRDFVFFDDFTDYIVACIDQPSLSQPIVNFATGTSVGIHFIISRMEELLGRKCLKKYDLYPEIVNSCLSANLLFSIWPRRLRTIEEALSGYLEEFRLLNTYDE